MFRFGLSLIALMFTISANSQYSWVNQNGPNGGENLYDVYMVNNFAGFCVGEIGGNALVYKTSNGGNPWAPNYAMVGEGSLEACYFIDQPNGYVISLDGDIWETTDTCNSWTEIYPEAGIVNGYNIIHTGARLIACRESELTWTSDFLTWNNDPAPWTGAVRGIHFSDVNNGWVCGDGGNLAYTNDGGNTWTPVTVTGTYASSDYYAVYTHSPGNVWVAGTNGALFKVNGFGISFDNPSLGSAQNMLDVHFANGTHGIAVGANNSAFYTTDGGTTWVPSPAAPSSVNHNSVFATNEVTAFMCGGDAEIWTSPIAHDITITSYIGPDTVCAGVPFDLIFTFQNVGLGASNGVDFNATVNSSGSPFFPQTFTGITDTGEVDTMIVNMVLGAGIHNVLLFSQDPFFTANNFFLPAFDIVAVAPNPTSVTASSNFFCPGDTIALEVTGGGTYNWLTLGGGNNATDPIQSVNPIVDWTYLVEIDQGYCVVFDSVSVTLDPNCMIDTSGIAPTPQGAYAFSPNNDGMNDVFILDFLNGDLDNTVTIYNRWGDEVYSVDGYDNINVAWDGSYNNGQAPAGTYFWIARTNQFGNVTGWVQLVK